MTGRSGCTRAVHKRGPDQHRTYQRRTCNPVARAPRALALACPVIHRCRASSRRQTERSECARSSAILHPSGSLGPTSGTLGGDWRRTLRNSEIRSRSQARHLQLHAPIHTKCDTMAQSTTSQMHASNRSIGGRFAFFNPTIHSVLR